MQMRVFENHEHLSRWAANQINKAIQAKPDLLLCLATGSTPTRCYEVLANDTRSNPEPYQQFRIVKLDEWIGLPMDASETCEGYLKKFVLDPMRVPKERYISFDSMAENHQRECHVIQEHLAHSGPIDLCILGLGTNGHLGFIEPDEKLELQAHVSTLSQDSRRHAMVKGVEHVPKFGFTLGIKDILQSQRVMLLVSGKHKREILKRLLEKQVSTTLPASFLHLHPQAVCAVDQEAWPD
jgi:galactosamine-6-phosphate isomerase